MAEAKGLEVKIVLDPVRATELKAGGIYAIRLNACVDQETFEFVARQLKREGECFGVQFILLQSEFELLDPKVENPE